MRVSGGVQALMASNQEDVQLAMEKLRLAVAGDRPGNESAALQLYVEATGGLFSVIRAESNPERKAKWTAHLTQYLLRAIDVETLLGRLAVLNSPDVPFNLSRRA
eukprot:COSAG02_NODE_913_length_15994_cov_6.140484_5_plen_105_part_00